MDDDERRKLGKDIAFGMQQTFTCWATDFIDPFIGNLVQNRFSDASHQGSLKHTWAGEIVGDSTALFSFLAVHRFFPSVTEGIKYAARQTLGPLLTHAATKHLAAWAEKEGVDETSTRYRDKLEEWKDFQAENIAKASVISASSIVMNVATQKAMGNTHRLPVIAASKIIGAAITLSSMMGLRLMLPQTTHQLDEELSEQYFSPLIHKTQKLFGAKATEDHPLKKSHTGRVRDHLESPLQPLIAR